MPEDVDAQEPQGVVRSKIEAFAYSSDIFPHPSVIEGYQKAIPDGGKEVITIVKRQQIFTFIYNMFSLLTNNLIPLILILPILFAKSSGAITSITIIVSVPIGLFTAGSAIDRVVTTFREGSAEERRQLEGRSAPSGQQHLPPDSSDSQP